MKTWRIITFRDDIGMMEEVRRFLNKHNLQPGEFQIGPMIPDEFWIEKLHVLYYSEKELS